MSSYIAPRSGSLLIMLSGNSSYIQPSQVTLKKKKKKTLVKYAVEF